MHPDHLKDLKNSGLSDDTIAEAEIYTVRPADISRIIKYPGVRSLMAFPYPHTGGFVRYKVFPPQGRIRYFQPAGTGSRLYMPKKFYEAAIAGEHVYITEGEKKALKACQEGYPCAAVGGLWNWGASGTLIPDFSVIHSKTVTFIPDSDVWARDDLKQAIYFLGKVLQERGIVMTTLQLIDNLKGFN